MPTYDHMLKNFRINIAFRLLVLLLLGLALAYSWWYTRFYITMALLALAIILLFWNLVNYVDRSNRDLANFLQGLNFGDYTASFVGREKGESFAELYTAFQNLNVQFQEIKAAKEINHLYLQTIVESVNIGLLCIGEKGEILLMNKALKELLQKPFLHSAKVLENSFPHLYEAIGQMTSGDKEVVKLSIENQLLQLAVQVTEFRLDQEYYKLIAIQNIQQELEEQELASWQKLIRILTHEIMNSVAPIVSLTSAMGDMFAEEKKELQANELQDIRQAIAAIQKRSAGLLRFTETYRNLTRIPPPQFRQVEVQSLLQNIATLFREELEQKGIALDLELPPSPLLFQADAELMEQVLINFLKNAIDAVNDQTDPQISITAFQSIDGRLAIQIADNGIGIEEEQLDQIFVPFFTTKATGSGIGLSLSRQIIRQHRGSIAVQSKVGLGTAFTLSF